MSLQDVFKTLNIPVTWGTVRLGWVGPAKCPRQLSATEVIGLAAECLEQRDAPADVVALAVADPEDTEDLRRLLVRLSEAEGFDAHLELRKWRLVLLKQLLDELPNDPIQALTTLTTFWADFEYPTDSPHEVQGRGSSVPPEDYFTETTLDRLLQGHTEWIRKETEALQSSRCQA